MLPRRDRLAASLTPKPELVVHRAITKNDTEAQAGLYRLLRKVDSESALAYTAVEEVRAMAGENIISKIEAMQVENKAAQNTMMAALDALHATLGALKAT